MATKVNFLAESTVITLLLACVLIDLSKNPPLKTGVNEDTNGWSRRRDVCFSSKPKSTKVFASTLHYFFNAVLKCLFWTQFWNYSLTPSNIINR